MHLEDAVAPGERDPAGQRHYQEGGNPAAGQQRRESFGLEQQRKPRRALRARPARPGTAGVREERAPRPPRSAAVRAGRADAGARATSATAPPGAPAAPARRTSPVPRTSPDAVAACSMGSVYAEDTSTVGNRSVPASSAGHAARAIAPTSASRYRLAASAQPENGESQESQHDHAGTEKACRRPGRRSPTPSRSRGRPARVPRRPAPAAPCGRSARPARARRGTPRPASRTAQRTRPPRRRVRAE